MVCKCLTCGVLVETNVYEKYSEAEITQYVADYRVSTDKQGIKGSGMDAQREAVSRFMAGGGELAAQFIEGESGRSFLPRSQNSGSAAPSWLVPSSTGSTAMCISFPA
jgi:hypothetical protein